MKATDSGATRPDRGAAVSHRDGRTSVPARPSPGALLLLAVALAVPLSAPPLAAQEATADRLLREAERLETAADPAAALDTYLLLLRQFPDDRTAPVALLRAAVLRRGLGDEAGADEALARLEREYPRSPQAAAAFLLQGEAQAAAARGLGDLEQARATLRRVPLLFSRARYPQLAQRNEARLRSAEIGRLLGEPEVAAGELLPILEEEPPGEWTAEAQLLLGTLELAGERWVPGAEILARLADGPASDLTAARARRLLSLVHRRLVRTAAGEPPWHTARALTTGGIVLRNPVGIAAAEDGRLVVVDDKLPAVVLLDADGRLLDQRPLAKLGRPGWGRDGRAFVASPQAVLRPFEGDRIAFTDPRPGKAGNLEDLTAAELDPLGRWYLLARGFKHLLSYDRRDAGRDDLLAGERSELQDLAQDALGRVYVLDAKASQVLRFGPGRGLEGVAAQGAWKRAEAIAVDALGDLFVLDRGNSRIEVFSPDGRPFATLGPQLGAIELRNPVDVAVDGAGRVYVADPRLGAVVVIE